MICIQSIQSIQLKTILKTMLLFIFINIIYNMFLPASGAQTPTPVILSATNTYNRSYGDFLHWHFDLPSTAQHGQTESMNVAGFSKAYLQIVQATPWTTQENTLTSGSLPTGTSFHVWGSPGDNDPFALIPVRLPGETSIKETTTGITARGNFPLNVEGLARIRVQALGNTQNTQIRFGAKR